MYSVDTTPFRHLPDSTLLREAEDPSPAETMTLFEHMLLTMYDCDIRDQREARECILEQVAEGYLEVVLHNKTPRAFEEWREGKAEWEEFFRDCHMLAFCYGSQKLVRADCIDWLHQAEPNSIAAVITDPPYGLIEYNREQQNKLRSGKGGNWRQPPSFDGSNRAPLPRFTTLSADDRATLVAYFTSWGEALLPILMPGAHVVVAGNPLVSPLVAYALEQAGFERRGEIIRLTRTFRGGDRPKGAEDEFGMISTMPRACYEPWGLYRKPLGHATVAANLRAFGVGGLRRLSTETPFLDVIPSELTPARERALAPHPSVKPQSFLRAIVDAVLPTGTGTILDPFAGSASTLAACEARAHPGIGIETDPLYFNLASRALPALATLGTTDLRYLKSTGTQASLW